MHSHTALLLSSARAQSQAGKHKEIPFCLESSNLKLDLLQRIYVILTKRTSFLRIRKIKERFASPRTRPRTSICSSFFIFRLFPFRLITSNLKNTFSLFLKSNFLSLPPLPLCLSLSLWTSPLHFSLDYPTHQAPLWRAILSPAAAVACRRLVEVLLSALPKSSLYSKKNFSTQLKKRVVAIYLHKLDDWQPTLFCVLVNIKPLLSRRPRVQQKKVFGWSLF